MPGSYLGIDKFTAATGRHPNIVLYFSGWFQPFATEFATTALAHHAVTLVQLDPFNAGSRRSRQARMTAICAVTLTRSAISVIRSSSASPTR